MAPKRAARSPARSPARAAPSPKRQAASPKPTRSSSKASKSEAVPTPRSSKAVADAVKAREAELTAARGELGLAKAPLKTCALFLAATRAFVMANGLKLLKSPVAFALVYPLTAAWLLTRAFAPEWYTPPDCVGSPAGMLYLPQLYVYELAWWLVLGILSSIGLGTGLHSGIMFLWPFVMSVITNSEACQSTNFVATYNHPCCLTCAHTAEPDGTLTFFNTFLLLAPSVIIWGSGTAIGELPPYFITRAARQAGKRATDFEEELADARAGTDIVSRLKVWTIDFTERHGFVGILLLASWPNAAFDMCGMACGWLEMPLWTFLGATLIGKGFVKVTLQTCVCITLFGKGFWAGLLALLPDVAAPAFVCAKAEVPSGVACTLRSVLEGGREKMMSKFSQQRRMLPAELLGKGHAVLTEPMLLDKYCQVRSVCGTKAKSLLATDAAYSNTAKAAEMAAVAKRAFAATDTDGDGKIILGEIEAMVGLSDGKLSLASLDPGTGGVLSLGNLWGMFIAGLVLFFVYSIVEQVALATQAEADSAELDALEAALKKTSDTSKKKTQ